MLDAVQQGCHDPSHHPLAGRGTDDADISVRNGAHFTNEDAATHTVTIFDDSGATLVDATLATGESWHFQPPHAGPYHVVCRFHSSMSADFVAS